MRRNTRGFLVLCVAAAGILGVGLHHSVEEHPAFAPAPYSDSVFILDAGHGGEDGGALSVTGTAESGINLAIAKKMDGILGFFGQKTVLLRSEDVSLHDPGAVTLREKKVSDLKNRANQVNACSSGVLISIHQNSYPGEKYWGLQTFYAPTNHSQALAEGIQGTVQTALQQENLRQAKPIPDNVYLMNHVQCPAVLVECGFLTNREEESRLRDEQYQRKLAAVLSAAVMNWAQSTTASE